MALKESIRKYQKEKAYIRRYGIKLNTNTDKDIIEGIKDNSPAAWRELFSKTHK